MSLILTSLLSRFEYITGSSSLSLEQIRLIAIVYWIFHISDFLRLFMISFKYGVILVNIFQLIVLYFYNCYFHIQYNYCSKDKDYLVLRLYNIFFFFRLKNISNISKFSFFSADMFIYTLTVLSSISFFNLNKLHTSKKS